MKVLCILALAVAVSAEADPQLLYKSLLPTTYVQKPLVYNTPVVSTYAKPLVYAQQPLVYKQAVPVVAPQYQAHSAGVSHTVLKREAEADPQLLYGGYKTYGYPAYQPVVYQKPVVYSKPVVYNTPIVAPVVTPVKTYANDAVKPFNYAAKGQYIANSAGVVHVAKREAEADPQLLYKSILPATTYVQKPVVYQTPVVYKQPEVFYKQPEAVVYKQPEVVYKQAVPMAYKPVVYNAPVVAPVMTPLLKAKTYSNDAVKPEDYAAKGMYHAENAGAVHIAKREADPYTIGYNTFQTSPTSFVSAPIVTPQQPAFYHTAGLTTYSHLFKRDAEAEPEAEAEAEPWMTYAGYGYGTPYMMSVGTPYSPNYYLGMRRGGMYGSRGYGYGNSGGYYYGK